MIKRIWIKYDKSKNLNGDEIEIKFQFNTLFKIK
jgi:hypothetical protein